MSKEIKQNLFRFVTLRNPQLIEDKKEHPGFVYHPSEDYDGSAYRTMLTETDVASKKALSKVVSDEFTPLKGRKGVKDYSQAMYDFSLWLMRNKNHLSYQSIKSNAEGVGNLTTEALLVVWDNLIYQTINKESVYAREALIQVLIANQFLKAFKGLSIGMEEFTDDTEKEFVRRANASVVISKSLFVENGEKSQSKKRLTESQEKAMLKVIETEEAKENLAAYKKLNAELKGIEIGYNKESQRSYDNTLKTHKASIAKILASTEPVVVSETDPRTGVVKKVKTYPNLELPSFNFENTKAIDSKYLKERLSPESMQVFDAVELGVYDDFSEVNNAINNQIQLVNQTILNNDSSTSGTVLVGGTTTTVSENMATLDPYCFFVSRLSSIGNPGLTMFLGTGYLGALASNASYTLENLDSNIKYEGTVIQTNSSFNNTSTRLFFPIAHPIDNNGSYRFSGKFTLDNGVTLSFDVTNDVSKRGVRFNGCCDAVKGDDTTDPAGGEVKPQVFGVTNLGIADFRRVEQEVCCYVPGEVSHIENIMAREYKERATRSLNSVETTSEETTEHETENLTDTTTTERNEMQSEVASVINEDKSQNYGANASVSYSPTKALSINAGGYADFSSSSSTSNSNSQAQTYAQEVTERAMERIVQKVSNKRTSRILREFEENNKHGFDNTKGDKHITGVYRWVDKIYKNKLINYGKRLMYEFAIPEPAKFFKEALWKKFKNDELGAEVVLPIKPAHPRDIGVTSPTSIIESTYQLKAAEYNAEVIAAPEKYDYVGTSFTKSQQGGDGGDNTNKSAKDVIKIPKGYKSIAAKTTGRQKNGAVLISVAGEDFPVNSSYYSTITPHLDELPVSVSFEWNWVTNVNIDVKCERTDGAYKQWQNETFNAIMEAYNDRLREYNESIIANEINQNASGEKLKFNPLFNRSIEKKELKRIAIELIIDQDRISKNNYNAINDATGLSKVMKTQGLQDHAATVKFFEQAFDWDIMSYIFYPYFYANEENWKDLFQSQDAADPLFQGFLQSGMARTIVPVRPGFEDAMNWYMSTGEIWNGQGLITDQDDDLYVSIAEEMQTVEGEVEDTWETRLPTNLTVIQAGSIGLNVEGLPCNIDCDDFALFDSDGKPILDDNGKQVTENPIEQTNTMVGGELDPTELEKVQSRLIENVDIDNGYLKLTTEGSNRQTVAQISVEAIKRAIDESVATTTTRTSTLEKGSETTTASR